MALLGLVHLWVTHHSDAEKVPATNARQRLTIQ
jgi:hypothetical protein